MAALPRSCIGRLLALGLLWPAVSQADVLLDARASQVGSGGYPAAIRSWSLFDRLEGLPGALPAIFSCSVAAAAVAGSCGGSAVAPDWPASRIAASYMYELPGERVDVSGSLDFLLATMRSPTFIYVCPSSDSSGRMGLGCFSAAELLPLRPVSPLMPQARPIASR